MQRPRVDRIDHGYTVIDNHALTRRCAESGIVSPPLRVPRKFFQHDGDEMVYVLEGQVEIHLGSEKIRLIPSPTDQNPWAHWRKPMDMMRQG